MYAPVYRRQSITGTATELTVKEKQMERFDVIEATFQPQNLETLKPKAEPWIGWRGLWSADWIIEDGAYEGTFAMCVVSDRPRPPFVWVPEVDLADIAPTGT